MRMMVVRAKQIARQASSNLVPAAIHDVHPSSDEKQPVGILSAPLGPCYIYMVYSSDSPVNSKTGQFSHKTALCVERRKTVCPTLD